MAIEPIFEKINYVKNHSEMTEQIRSECKTDVFCEEIESVLNVSARAVVNSVTAMDGKVEYNGKIVYYISYQTVDGQLKKAECGNEFSGIIKDAEIKSDMRSFATVTVDKCQAEAGGVKLSVNAYLTVKVFTSKNQQKDALSGGNNLIIDKKEVPFVKSMGVRQGSYPLEEEFELDYPVEEVVSHRADAIITAVQCGVGTIIVDGEVLLSIIVLQKNEKRDIIRENKSLPFRMEIECEEAMPTMNASARVFEKSYKTDVLVDENKGTSVVSASVVLKFEGEAFVDSELSLVSDAFSVDQDIELITEEIPYLKTCEMRCLSAFASGRVGVEQLPIGSVLLAVGGESAYITEKKCEDGALKVSGILTAVGYFKNEGKFFTRKLETPFECSFDCAFSCDTELEVHLKPQKAKGKIVTLEEVDLEAEMLFNVYPTVCERINLVSGVKTVGEKKKKDCALSVYIPVEGEELWSLAKRLNVCPETLIETNKDLCFPLTGKERIVLYRQK